MEGKLYQELERKTENINQVDGSKFHLPLTLAQIKEVLDVAKDDFGKMYTEANKVWGTSFEEEVKIYEAWFEKWFGADPCKTCAMGLEGACKQVVNYNTPEEAVE